MEINSFENRREVFNLWMLLLESSTVWSEDLLPSLKESAALACLALKIFLENDKSPCLLYQDYPFDGEDAMKSDKNVVMKPNGRRYSTSEWGDSISAACAGFGVHISMSTFLDGPSTFALFMVLWMMLQYNTDNSRQALVNNENVVKVGHRQVVNMIRQGGNHLVLKVVTVTRNLDPDDTARKKAPPPPKRAPTTALTLRSKSMTSELEELVDKASVRKKKESSVNQKLSLLAHRNGSQRRLGSKFICVFHCGGVDDGDLSAGNNGNTIKATFTALTASTPSIVSSISNASTLEESFLIFTRHCILEDESKRHQA
ncbi:hypothetical protein Q9966_013311 [Columba livia]|nr:hypothetical protein Q9966_013311 [Columba livia]